MQLKANKVVQVEVNQCGKRFHADIGEIKYLAKHISSLHNYVFS